MAGKEWSETSLWGHEQNDRLLRAFEATESLPTMAAAKRPMSNIDLAANPAPKRLDIQVPSGEGELDRGRQALCSGSDDRFHFQLRSDVIICQMGGRFPPLPSNGRVSE
jgi:hypothetical protein